MKSKTSYLEFSIKSLVNKIESLKKFLDMKGIKDDRHIPLFPSNKLQHQPNSVS